LIQVVKERFDQVFRLNRGRAFYSSLSICQAVFEEFFVSSQPLALQIRASSRQREAHSTAFKTAVNHLFQPLSIHSTEATNKIKPLPCQPGAFYSNSPSAQPLFSSNPLNFKEFSERTAPEVVRIVGAQFRTSTPFCSYFQLTYFYI
jgi:hypothetical protein